MICEQMFRLKKDGTCYMNCLCRTPELIESYDKAITDTTQVWNCHHRLETHTSDGERRLVDISRAELIALGMYYDRPPEELIFLTKKEMVVLAPPKTFWDLLPHLDSFHIVGNISGLFDTTSKESGDLLSCGLVKEEKIKDPKYTHQYDLAQITDKQRQLMKAVEKYNSTHEPFYAELMRQMTLNNKKFYPNVNEDLIFTVPIYTPHNKVHANDSADRRHNIERKPVEWRDSSSCDYGILFKDDISYKNFCNWWYKVPGMYGESEKTFLWNSLEVLSKCFGGDPSINKYPLTFPNLDWSHPWTDQEILSELGLPEDFFGVM